MLRKKKRERFLARMGTSEDAQKREEMTALEVQIDLSLCLSTSRARAQKREEVTALGVINMFKSALHCPSHFFSPFHHSPFLPPSLCPSLCPSFSLLTARARSLR